MFKYRLPMMAGVLLLLWCEPHDEVLSEIPIEYQNYCYELGREYNVSPNLLIAIIEHESSGDPNAKNGKCVGLMQINEDYVEHYISGADVWDARTNIEIGILTLLEKADSEEAAGDVAVALAMYNGQTNPDPENEYVTKILERAAELDQWDNGL